MQKIFGLIGGLWLAFSGAANAEGYPVVVELYTSQGCSSCPPADALLAELAKRDDVIPLALHVDYWDYIGWADIFADPAFTKRQKDYARAAGRRMVYTPQMIVGGADPVVGYKPLEVEALIKQHKMIKSRVSLTVVRDGDQVRISASLQRPVSGGLVVQLVQFREREKVNIRKGENAGRVITYSNIVTSWQHLRNWDGRSDLSLTAEANADMPVAVIIQKEDYGPVLAAAMAR